MRGARRLCACGVAGGRSRGGLLQRAPGPDRLLPPHACAAARAWRPCPRGRGTPRVSSIACGAVLAAVWPSTRRGLPVSVRHRRALDRDGGYAEVGLDRRAPDRGGADGRARDRRLLAWRPSGAHRGPRRSCGASRVRRVADARHTDGARPTALRVARRSGARRARARVHRHVQRPDLRRSADTVPPEASNAAFFWSAAKNNIIVGRCVRLGSDDESHYHWAIRTIPSGETVVHEFWDAEVWTTQRYGLSLSSGRGSDLMGRH
jgi:hypothetical protein